MEKATEAESTVDDLTEQDVLGALVKLAYSAEPRRPGEFTTREIAERTGKTDGAISSTYNRLVKRGLAGKRRAMVDGEELIVYWKIQDHICGTCSKPLQEVRPGKWQCGDCE